MRGKNEKMDWAACCLPASVMLAGLLISVSAILFTGCGLFSGAGRETKQLYNEIGDSEGSLIKTLVVVPFENNAQLPRTDLMAPFLKKLKSAIEKECDQVRVLLPDSPGFPARLKQLQRQKDGEIDNYALALSGRASGVNLVLSGRLVGIRHIAEDRGALWFTKTHHLARIQMEVAVFHTGTGAKLFDKTVFYDIEIEEPEGLRIEKKEMPDTIVMADALANIAETIGEMGYDVFKFIPWEGHIIGVEGDRLVLSSGEPSGLKKGKVLDVFSVDKVTTGKEGRRFFIQGGKIGRITLTAVYPDRSEAVLKEGGPIPPGSVARLP